MLKGLAHVCFTVRSLDVSIAFYQLLGLKPAFDFINDKGARFGVYLRVGGRNFVELFQGEHDAPGKPSYKHFCIEVDELPGLVAELRGRGVEISDPKLGTDRSWQAWVADPDGNRIELHAYTPESKQGPHLK